MEMANADKVTEMESYLEGHVCGYVEAIGEADNVEFLQELLNDFRNFKSSETS